MSSVLSDVHIHAPAPIEVRTVYRICTSRRFRCAGSPKRRMTLKFYEWYGPSLTCLTYGKWFRLEE